MLKELSIVEQRYQAVLAVIADGEPVRAVADGWGVSRQTVHTWLARYEAAGLDGLVDRSHRPASCPHRMAASVEAAVLELRRARPWWGPRRLRHELARRHPGLVGEYGLASESAIYRLLVRAGLIEPTRRRRRAERFKRWERGQPMELWQLDVVGGFGLADGTSCKALTGLDDHSRFCVSARLMPREQTRAVCAGFAAALRAHGVPAQVLTDNGRVFTGRFHRPPVEVLFDRICRENGIEHLLTQPRSPTTTGKIERFHRSLRAEFDTRRLFASIEAAQAELDQWVAHYNNDRPHQALDLSCSRCRSRVVRGGVPVGRSVSGTHDRLPSDLVTCNIAAWQAHESGYASIASVCASKASGLSRSGCPTSGLQSMSRKLTASRLPSLQASMMPMTRRSLMPSLSTGTPRRSPASEAGRHLHRCCAWCLHRQAETRGHRPG